MFYGVVRCGVVRCVIVTAGDRHGESNVAARASLFFKVDKIPGELMFECIMHIPHWVLISYYINTIIPDMVSPWVAGLVELPPTAIKDAENVGSVCQICFVSDCQDSSGMAWCGAQQCAFCSCWVNWICLLCLVFDSMAVELGIANPKEDKWDNADAQRLLLKKGDCFYIPPGNIYRQALYHWLQ